MAKLDAKALEDIDILAAFCAESERNHELMQIMARFMYIAKIPGAPAVFKKRFTEEKRRKAPQK